VYAPSLDGYCIHPIFFSGKRALPFTVQGTQLAVQLGTQLNLPAQHKAQTKFKAQDWQKKKAIAHSRKGAIEIAQDLLVKKLGDLAGKNSTPDDFDIYAQHFARPLEKTTMEAIQDLIEHGAMIQKKDNIQREAAKNPGLAA
jgi:hypothetical protein